MNILHITTRRWILALSLSLLFAAGCSNISAVEEGALYGVQNVVDGDTIRLDNGMDVRYIGIDTPETMKRGGSGWMFQPEEYGVAAKEFNRSMVSGRKVRLEFDREKKDKYGRLLAYVYVDGKMANLELVRKGLATVYTFPPNTMHLDRLLEAQSEARAEKKGLWGAMKSVPPGDASNHIGEFCIVKGMITGVYVSSSRIYLNFGQDRRKYLTAVINARNMPLFLKEDIDPASYYSGRFVEAAGKIEDRGGPRMIIDNPSQITLLAEK